MDQIQKNFGFGCIRLPMQGENVDIPETKRMVDAFLEAGFNYFDTAHGYLQGKSETALELIKRGHKLIADDAVDIRRIGRFRLVGTAPELIRYYMELRGIGVVDVRHLYGVGAVKPEGSIDLVVNLEAWDDQKAYDRLGLTSETQDILGVTVPSITVPVRPGRNLAVILELAAMNNRQKKMGYNAAEALASSVDQAVDSGMF